MITRTSPITLPQRPVDRIEEEQAGLQIEKKYEPFNIVSDTALVDLSHRPKMHIKGPMVEYNEKLAPGEAIWSGTGIVACSKRDEYTLFNLFGSLDYKWNEDNYTDITDGLALIGLIGHKSGKVMSKLVSLDHERPGTDKPFLLMTHSHGIPVQIINLKRKESGFLISCNRSQGQLLFDACIHKSKAINLKIIDVDQFNDWLNPE